MEFAPALGAGGFDDGKPSLFELLSEQQLSALLPPTLRYLLTLATERHPRHLLRVLNAFDELYALAALLVERHHLRTRGGSFTEHFYGLQRERLPVAAAALPRAAAAAPRAARDALRLAGPDVWRALAVLVGVPYLKRKLDAAHERDAPRALLGAGYHQLPARPRLRDRAAHFWRWFLRRAYPGLNAAWGLAALAFHLAYLFDNARCHAPLLWLVGQRVRRMTGADYAAIEAAAAAAAAGAGAGARGGTALASPRGVARAALGGLSVLLPAGIFALKFLEWWHASDFAHQLSRRAAESLDLPPPVVSGLDAAAERKRRAAEAEDDKRGAEDEDEDEDEDEEAALVGRAPIATPSMLPVLTVAAPADSSLCPICGDDIATATACQTGVVYCYGCIHRWVGGEHPRQEAFMAAGGGRAGRWESGAGRCAVTGRRVLGGTEGLRRVMV